MKVLGSLLWFSITGAVEAPQGRRSAPVRVTQPQLERWFDELGLDPDFLPPTILKVDAFRRATSRRKKEYEVGGRRMVLRVEEIESTREYVERQVLRTVVDPRARSETAKTASDWMATIKFMRAGRTARGKRADGDHYRVRMRTSLDAPDREQVLAMLAEIDRAYGDLAVNIDEDKIRALLRGYLTHLGAIAVRPSGAMYFVQSESQRQVDALGELIVRVGQGCTFAQVPYVDSAATRLILSEAFQHQVADEVRGLLRRAQALAPGPVTPRAFADLRADYELITERAAQVSADLGLAQESTADILEEALTAVTDLSRKITFAVTKRRHVSPSTATSATSP